MGNINYWGWTSMSVTRSMETGSGSFTITLADVDREGQEEFRSKVRDIREDSPCRVYIQAAPDIESGQPSPDVSIDQPLMTGYINSITRSRSGEQTSLTISGRDKTQDLIDCSAITKSNGWTEAKLERIATDLAQPFDVFVDDRTDAVEPFKTFSVQSGETAFETIERACRLVGVLPIPNRFGDLVLTYATEPDTPGTDPLESLTNTVLDLVEGENILEINETKTSTERYSEYLVKGQDSGRGKKWDSTTLRVRGNSRDSGVNRHRPLVITAEGKTTAKKAQVRANWEAQVRRGRSAEYTVTVQGWFQAPPGVSTDNKPWDTNLLVNLISNPLNVRKVLLITEVNFELDAETGRRTILSLKDPSTYKQNPDEVQG